MADSNYWLRHGRRSTSRRTFVAGGATGLAALIAAACSSSNNKAGNSKLPGTNATRSALIQGSPEAALAQAKRGGTFNIDQPDEPISLDNHRQETPGSIQAANLVYNHLLRRWEDFLQAPGAVYIADELAQTYEQVDQLTYKFHLVKNAKWHNVAPVNGRAFTSADVKYSIERMGGTDPELRTRSAFAPVDKVETPDPYTVVVTTKQPYAAFIPIIGHTWSIMMPHELADTPDVNRKAIGTGPFLFKDWQSGVALHFDRNPNYFRTGQPYFDHVTMRIVPDQAARTANFRAGEVDIWGGAPPTIPTAQVDDMQKVVPDVTRIKRT
ncbi:MAG: ABC transporter substrate-binding protein, partial [Dehalococcoidia bacterium]